MTDEEELFAALVAFGKLSYPRISDLERIVGPLFVDLDSPQESTHYVERPPHDGGSFLYLDVHEGELRGRRVRLSERHPTPLGDSRVAPRPFQEGEIIEAGRSRGRVVRHPGLSASEDVAPMVRSLDFRLDYDHFHDSPHRDANRSLVHGVIVLHCEHAALESALGASFGPARALADGTVALHPFYLDPPGTHPRMPRLTWSKRVPEKALPAVDDDVRKLFVMQLGRTLPSLATIADVAAFVEPYRAHAGISEARSLAGDDLWMTLRPSIRSLAGDDLWMTLRPSIDARLLCRLLRWQSAFAVTHDTHMASWEIEVEGQLPRAGRWVLDARLDGWPRRVDGRQREARGTYDLVEHSGGVAYLVVRHLRDHDEPGE